jgi:hypothetical protein
MSAREIVQTYLDEVSAIVMANDWKAYTDVLCRPFMMITHAETLTFATPDDIRALYDRFRDLLQSQRVTDYIRLVDAAEQIDPDLISARYVTHLLSGGMRIMDPVKSGITLRLEGNRWRAASITNAVSNSRWPLLMPRLGPAFPVKGPDHD